MTIAFELPERLSVSLLRRKIGWVCQLIRWLVVVWLAWQFYVNFEEFFRIGASQIAIDWGRNWGLKDGSITAGGVWLNHAILLVNWTVAASMGVAVWRLMRGYLAGDILSVEAARRMRLVGLTGLAAAAAEVILRPFMLGALSMDIVRMIPAQNWVDPRDMLYFVIALFVLSLSHIQGTAAVISDEHKQFV
jgi:hypothetical protein